MDDKFKQGFDGEAIVRQILKDCKHQFGQIDLVSVDKKDGKIYIWEIKHQQRFKAPPFDGHGLPPYQFNFRLKIARLTGMIPFLLIIEPEIDLKGERNMFYQNMFTLEALGDDKKFITGGDKKRLIFNIDAFFRYKIPQTKNK
tara:strand:+ start:4727 stop:5155 length:429 start_codon:yes stop_codon:yes gene_type:complete